MRSWHLEHRELANEKKQTGPCGVATPRACFRGVPDDTHYVFYFLFSGRVRGVDWRAERQQQVRTKTHVVNEPSSPEPCENTSE